MRKIDQIFIHCSAGHSDLEGVKRWWHGAKPNGMGWKTGGYHKWVDYDGLITDVYPLATVTNGVRDRNSNSVHICYRGGVQKKNVRVAEDTRTEMQKVGLLEAIREVLEELKRYQDITKIKILGHRDASPDKNGNGVIDPWERIKDCPSFEAKAEYSWITV
jgi:N-acetylmuramoyl-L-alanine amidase